MPSIVSIAAVNPIYLNTNNMDMSFTMGRSRKIIPLGSM